MNEDMEDAVFQWICDMRERNLHVSHRMIKDKARTNKVDSFKASTGWLTLFMKHKNLSFRRKTTVSQSVPAQLY